jgi:predicted transcriptional regulator
VSQVLSLELSDEVYAALQQQAEVEGVSLAELVATSIEQPLANVSKVMLASLTWVMLQEQTMKVLMLI